MRPPGSPRGGAVCRRTAPRLTAAGYAREKVTTVSTPAKIRSKLLCRCLTFEISMVSYAHRSWNATYGGIKAQLQSVDRQKRIGEMVYGFERRFIR